MGCFGVGCIGVIAIVVLIVIVAVVSNAISASQTSGSGGASSQNSGSGGTSASSGRTSAGSSDPIEQARVVLGGSYSYDHVKEVTDAALSATATEISSENYSRAWSAVLKVSDGLPGVLPMDVMLCVVEIGPTSRMSFAESTALCATTIHLEQ